MRKYIDAITLNAEGYLNKYPYQSRTYDIINELLFLIAGISLGFSIWG